MNVSVIATHVVGLFSLFSTAVASPNTHAPSRSQSSQAAIFVAAARWHVSPYWLLRVARCESGLNPWAYNPSGASGLFQFMPSTYYPYARRIGEVRSLWNPWGAANVAAYMFHIGLSYEWTCR